MLEGEANYVAMSAGILLEEKRGKKKKEKKVYHIKFRNMTFILFAFYLYFDNLKELTIFIALAGEIKYFVVLLIWWARLCNIDHD